ncbi:MAG: carboxymuconolactone decarboxylase family protein [Acidimicrobiales bacterium]
MARIEPVPWEELPDEAKAMIEEGQGTGMYTTPVPMQVMAYSSVALRSMHDAYRATFGKGILEPRLVELLRLRSAQAGGCAPCSASRKDGSVADSDVACLADPDSPQFTPRESAALKFFDLIAYDHLSITDETYRQLQRVFTTAEIVEMAYLCANAVGTHRFLHTLEFASGGPPLIPYRPGDIDRSGTAAVATA